MRPSIEATGFGWMKIDGKRYTKDVLIRPSGEIEKRRKKLSKKFFGTSHRMSLEEAEHVLSGPADLLVVGTGQYGRLTLTEEARDHFRSLGCEVRALPTPEALEEYNRARGEVAGLFHLTC